MTWEEAENEIKKIIPKKFAMYVQKACYYGFDENGTEIDKKYHYSISSHQLNFATGYCDSWEEAIDKLKEKINNRR